MKNKYYRLVILLFIIMFSFNVKANTVNKIDMDVYIDSNGNARVIEIWHANLTSGTEGYRSFSKLNGSEINNISVSDETGRIYEMLDTWNSDDGFNNKAYKTSLVNKGNESELCFGISSYGSKVYTIKYDVSNIVRKYSDAEGIYYSFLQMDMSVNEAKVTIRSDIPFSLDNARIWGLGYEGNSSFNNGNIILSTKNGLNKNNRMVALVRFNGDIFDTHLTISKSFDDIYDEAFDSFSTSKSKLTKYLVELFLFFSGFIGILAVIFSLISRKAKRDSLKGSYIYDYNSNNILYGIKGKELPNEVKYWREIPCNKNINYAFWICSEYGIVKNKELLKGLIGSYILKWFKNGNINVLDNNKKYSIDFSRDLISNDTIEKYIYQLIKKAAGNNLILESNELKKWSKKNYNKINNIGIKIYEIVVDYLANNNLINKKKDTLVGNKVNEEAANVEGFIKYLKDFGSMNEKNYIEVKVWEDYLIFAELFGIADKVREQFKKLYPNVKTADFAEYYKLLDTFEHIAEDFACSCIAGASSGYKNSLSNSHDYSGYDSSSGGGGSSFSSGGGSAGGSSGGGFR